jgi:hypothetical protein
MTAKPSKPQMNLLRSLAGLEDRQPRMKPVVYNTCESRGWVKRQGLGFRYELTDAGRVAAGI